MHILRGATSRDLDGDGSLEVLLTLSTYPKNVAQPVRILEGEAAVATDATSTFFPRGIPALRNASYTVFTVPGDDDAAGDVLRDPEADEAVGIGGHLLVDQHLTVVGADGHVHVLAGEFPTAGAEVMEVALVRAGLIGRQGQVELVAVQRHRGLGGAVAQQHLVVANGRGQRQRALGVELVQGLDHLATALAVQPMGGEQRGRVTRCGTRRCRQRTRGLSGFWRGARRQRHDGGAGQRDEGGQTEAVHR